MTAQAENLVRLLGGVSAELKAVRTARERYAVKLSPDFNCFDYIEPDELRLSQILAELLNPKGSHAQASRFLDAFLRQIGLGDWEPKAVESVKREDPTHNGRRVDIRIRWTDGCELVIENKPWANDLKDQLLHYIKDLQCPGNRPPVTSWHVVYLGGKRSEPNQISLNGQRRDQCIRENKLTLTTYGDLIVPWLTECMGVCESDRFRWFLGEFKAYVLAEFRGQRDMAVTNAVDEKVLESHDTLDAALEIHAAFERVQMTLLSNLKQQLRALVKSKGWSLDWEDLNRKGGGINVHFLQRRQSYLLRFEFEEAKYGNFFFGIRKSEISQPINTSVRLIMDTGLGRSGNPNAWWLWWQYFDDSLKNWSASPAAWQKMRDESLAPYLFRLIENVYNAFDNEKKLDLLE